MYYFQFYFYQVLAGVAVSCVCQSSQGTEGPGGLCEPKQEKSSLEIVCAKDNSALFVLPS